MRNGRFAGLAGVHTRKVFVRTAGSSDEGKPPSRCIVFKKILTRIADNSGSVLVETALVLPFYFLIVFGLISFAMIFFGYCSATYAAKAAVRYAAVHSEATLSPCTSSTIQTMVTANLWAVPTGGVTITSQWSPSNSIGSVVSVQIKLNYGSNMPFVNLTNFVGTASSQGYVVF